jgi:hypothetical protein
MQCVLFPDEGPFDKPSSRLSKWMEEALSSKKSDVDEDWVEGDKEEERLGGLLGDPEHPKLQGREKKSGKKGSWEAEGGKGLGQTSHRRRGKKARRRDDDDGW